MQMHDEELGKLIRTLHNGTKTTYLDFYITPRQISSTVSANYNEV